MRMRTKILATILAILTILSVSATFLKTIILQDFEIIEIVETDNITGAPEEIIE